MEGWGCGGGRERLSSGGNLQIDIHQYLFTVDLFNHLLVGLASYNNGCLFMHLFMVCDVVFVQ